MELRQQIAQIIAETTTIYSWSMLSDHGKCGPYLKAADKVLDIDEIRESLNAMERGYFPDAELD
jgi:hypothetical protein